MMEEEEWIRERTKIKTGRVKINYPQETRLNNSWRILINLLRLDPRVKYCREDW